MSIGQRLSLLIALTLCIVTFASAQEFTGNINGRISDSSGAVLPGVSATLKSPALQGTRNVVTDETGNYRFILLAPGVYSVTYELPGFKTLVREGVVVQVGVTTTLNVALEISQVAETITVTGESPVVDVQNATVGVNFGQSLLRDLPTARDLWVVLSQTPGIQTTRFDVGGATMGTQTTYRSYGLRDQNWVNLDGIVTTEGTSGAGFYMDYGAFQEIQISAAANSAEVPVPGAFINTVVKTGGNDLRGEVYFDWEDDKFQGKNVTDELRDRGIGKGDQFTRYNDFNYQVGGPLKRDKLWWFFSGRDQFSGLLTEVRQVPSGGGSFVPVEEGTIGGAFTTRLQNYTTKFNYQVNPNNSLIFTGQVGRKFQPYRGAQGNNASFFNLDSTGIQDSWSWVYKFQWTSVLNSKMTMDVSANTFGYHFPLRSHVDETPRRDTGTNFVRGGYSGTGIGNTTTVPNRNQRRRWHWNANVTYFAGNHDLKFGYGFIWEDQRVTSKSVPGSPGSLDGIVLYYLNGRPDRFQVQNTPFLSWDSLYQNFLFVQDKWKLSPRVTLSLGLRYDRYSNFSPEQGNPGTGAWASKLSYERTTYPTFNNLVPRVAVNWDIFGNTRTAFKASYGRYSENVGHQISSFANPNSQVITRRYSWDGRPVSQITQAYVATLSPLETIGQAQKAAIDPNLENAYTDEFTAGLSHELFTDLGIHANFVRKFSKNPFERLNRAQPLSAFSAVPAIDLGLDGVRGSGDDRAFTIFERTGAGAAQDLMVTSFKGMGSNFTTFELNATKRLSSKWQMLTGFDWTKRNLAPVLRESNDPNILLYSRANSGGNQFSGHHTTNWTYKLSGTYQLPYGVFVHGIYNAQKGEAYGRTQSFNAATLNVPGRTNNLAQGTVTGVYVEPEGAYFYPNVHLTNFRAEKKFNITERQTVSAMFDLFNIFNSNTVTGVNTTTSTTTHTKVDGTRVTNAPTFGRVTQILNPRIFRLGIRWMF